MNNYLRLLIPFGVIGVTLAMLTSFLLSPHHNTSIEEGSQPSTPNLSQGEAPKPPSPPGEGGVQSAGKQGVEPSIPEQDSAEPRVEQGRFAVVIPLTLVHEGGARYTNHPSDPGGPTKYGITIHDVRKYLKKGATAGDVQALTKAQAVRIYKKHYWDAIDADNLPVGLDYTVFDYTVNAGQGRSLPALKRCFVTHGGDNSIALIRCVNDDRMRFQMGLGGKYVVFHRGWRNRIESVLRISLNMAAPSLYKAGPPTDLIPRVGTGKAYEETDQ